MTVIPEDVYAALIELVRDHAGLIFPENRRAGTEDAIARAMADAQVAAPAEFLRRLRSGEAALVSLIDQLTIGETYFFRDPLHFDVLREQALPQLFAAGRSAVRLWSAGCASGEEAYSLAMLLLEPGAQGRGTVLGTDISPTALLKARRGCYRPWSLRGDDQERARRHLSAQGELLCVAPEVRRLVTFRPLNLASSDYPSWTSGTAELDVIFCRNVLLYLSAEAVAQVARRLFDSLSGEGWLFTGPSDPPLDELVPFKTLSLPGGGICYRRPESGVAAHHGAAIAAAPASAGDAAPERERARGPARVASPGRPRPAADEPARADRAEEPRALAKLLRSNASRAGSAAAEREAARAVLRHPLAAELHYLHAQLLSDLGRIDEAAAALRRFLYLEPDNPVGHLLLGWIERARGDVPQARRAFRIGLSLIEQRDLDERLELADGETCRELAQHAATALSSLDPEAPEASDA